MIISHETPLCLLKESRKFNDYDYALVHLFEKYPEYFEFFKESLDNGRTVILDNSLYELGTAFDMTGYAYWIKRLHPTAYIVPDAFWDSGRTINLHREWMEREGKYLPKSILRIGVAQGATYDDIERTYKYMDTTCDIIAFTFKFPQEMRDIVDDELKYYGRELSDADIQALIRYRVLRRLEDSGVINKNKWHHLLGIQNTFALSRTVGEFPWLRSIDTSNPVVYGLRGHKYEPVFEHASGGCSFIYNGNSYTEKLTDTIDGMFDGENFLSQMNVDRIYQNIHDFRDIINGNTIILPSSLDDDKRERIHKGIDTLLNNKSCINQMQISNIIARL